MQSIPGVVDAQSGYANGTGEADANYRTVCTRTTGFRETVRVEYDPEQVSLDALLLAYFYVIDSTVQNRQSICILFFMPWEYSRISLSRSSGAMLILSKYSSSGLRSGMELALISIKNFKNSRAVKNSGTAGVEST